MEPVTDRDGLGAGVEEDPCLEASWAGGVHLLFEPLDMSELAGRGGAGCLHFDGDDGSVASLENQVDLMLAVVSIVEEAEAVG